MIDWASGEVFGAVVGTSLGAVVTSVFWMLNKSNGKGSSGGNGRSAMQQATVTYQDLVKHCGAQQALRDKSLETMFAPIRERLERGEIRFDELQKEIHQNHIDVLHAIREG